MNLVVGKGSLPDIAPELISTIVSTATDIAICIDNSGAVLSVLTNLTHQPHEPVERWHGRDFRSLLTEESIPKFEARLRQIREGEAATGYFELNHVDETSWQFPIRYSLHSLGVENQLLLLGRDLSPIAEVQQELVKAHIALQRDHESQREFDTRYRVLMTVSRDALVLASLARGRIIDANKSAAYVFETPREKLIGASFEQLFVPQDGGLLSRLSASHGLESDPLLTAKTNRRVKLTPTIFRASGERLVFCRIEPVEVDGPDGWELGENLRILYHEGAEAVVFTDKKGVIIAANDPFLALAEATDLSAVRGRSLADLLARGGVDLKILTENAARNGHMRLFSTKMVGEFGAEVPIELSATYLNDRENPIFASVARDVGKADLTRARRAPLPRGGARNIGDLVGARDLKSIVAETTEVVEKMCIETAIDLTRNNRVAAAEMLGLSRQSLYVKLRKYGLLERGEES